MTNADGMTSRATGTSFHACRSKISIFPLKWCAACRRWVLPNRRRSSCALSPLFFAGENNGESAQLDRRRFGKTHRLHAAHHFSGKIEILERHAWKLVPVARLVIPSAFVIPSEVACRAVALCEGWEESLTISLLKGKWRCLGFARHDKSAGH